MKKTQKSIALEREGDAFMRRHEYQLLDLDQVWKNDPVIKEIKELEIPCENVPEIGCANGYRLASLNKYMPANYYGMDPSCLAIENGKALYRGINLCVGTADSISYHINFNLIIYGFCLYLCDRDDLFKIAYEAHRHLATGGVIIILDFYSKYPKSKDYIHNNEMKTYKFPYRDMFLWSECYELVSNRIIKTYNATQKVMEQKSVFSQLANFDGCVSVSVIYKV